MLLLLERQDGLALVVSEARLWVAVGDLPVVRGPIPEVNIVGDNVYIARFRLANQLGEDAADDRLGREEGRKRGADRVEGEGEFGTEEVTERPGMGSEQGD